MGSPLILLIIWFVINLFIKSANDKRKIEEARRKRAQQLGNLQPSKTRNVENKRPTFQQEIRKTVSTLREEIEKEIQKEKQRKIVTPKKENVYRSKMEINQLPSEEDLNWENYTPRETKVEIQEKTNKEVGKTVIDVKNDIIRGIIFSEILSEPKSIQNIKRSM